MNLKQIIVDSDREFEEKFTDIMGLETDPDGRKGMYLIRDQDDVIQHGIDFDDEKDEIKAFLHERDRKILEAVKDMVEERLLSYEKLYDETHPSYKYIALHAYSCKSAFRQIKEFISTVLDK